MKKLTKYLLALCLSFKALSASEPHPGAGFDPDAATGGGARGPSSNNIRIAVTVSRGPEEVNLEGCFLQVLPTRRRTIPTTEILYDYDLERSIRLNTLSRAEYPEPIPPAITETAAHVAGAPIRFSLDAGPFYGSVFASENTAPSFIDLKPLCILCKLVRPASAAAHVADRQERFDRRSLEVLASTVVVIPLPCFADADEDSTPGTRAHAVRLPRAHLPLVHIPIQHPESLQLEVAGDKNDPRLGFIQVTTVRTEDWEAACPSTDSHVQFLGGCRAWSGEVWILS